MTDTRAFLAGLEVTVVRSPRARRYILRVTRTGGARLTIPRGGSQREGQAFLERNLPWLKRQLDRHHSRPHLPARWPVGTPILLRGVECPLRLIQDDGRPAVVLGHERVEVPPALNPAVHAAMLSSRARRGISVLSQTPATTSQIPLPPRGIGMTTNSVRSTTLPSPPANLSGQLDLFAGPATLSPLDLRPMVEAHCRALAQRELPPRTFQWAARLGITIRQVQIRNQRSRWGSCSRRGTVSLNWRLLQVPPAVSDYLIIHELMHLREMNHSRRFWAHVAAACPTYREAERWLRQHGWLLR